MLGAAALIFQDIARPGQAVLVGPELLSGPLLPVTLLVLACIGTAEALRASATAREQSSERRVYPQRQRGGRRRPPGLGVWSAWLGGLPGWLSGGWGLEPERELSAQELEGRKANELGLGRLAM